MKKLLLSFILGIGFGAYSYALDSSLNIEQQQNQDQKKAVKKTEKYDFSLFKFTSPKQTIEKDSIEQVKEQLPAEKLEDETTYEIQNPRVFFRFSYAS
jgi:uncharacterized FAD-dependent dehydrogenase